MTSPIDPDGRGAGASGPSPKAAVRQRVATAYRLAFNGSATSSIQSLKDSSYTRDPSDRIHLGIARSHLLYLDGQSAEALQIIETEVLPLVDQFATNLREIVDYNRTIAAHDCTSFPTQAEVDRHHALVDRRAAVGFKSGDPSKLLEADRALGEGKLYDALPIYASAFYKAFNAYDWSAWKEAAARLSRTDLLLGDVPQATFYAIVSEDDGAVDRLARDLVARNESSAIRQAIDTLKRKANLARHCIMGFKLVTKLGWAVPDDLADCLSDLCRPYRRSADDWWGPKSAGFDLAWKASAVVAPAMSCEAADMLADDAITHPRWRDGLSRKDWFYPALSGASQNFSDSIVIRVIDAVAPCARAPSDCDFEAATFLLADLYDARPAQQGIIRAALFPLGESAPAHVARMAERFDVKPPDEDLGERMQQVYELLDSQISTGEKGPSIAIGQDINVILYIAGRRTDLSERQVDGIVGRMLDLCEHPRNVNFNRARMIECTSLFIDSLGHETGIRASRIFAKYAGNHREPGHPLYGEPEHENLLNPFRMGGVRGWPQDVRGHALMALAGLALRPELVVGVDVGSLIGAALEDQNWRVRRDACIAVARAEGAFCDLLAIVAIRGVDSTAMVASTALHVLAYSIKDVARLLLVGPTLAVVATQAQHVDSEVRAAAAAVVASLRELQPSPVTADERRRLDAVTGRLASDVARPVRLNLRKGGSTNNNSRLE